jgi:hypothetical protein
MIVSKRPSAMAKSRVDFTASISNAFYRIQLNEKSAFISTKKPREQKYVKLQTKPKSVPSAKIT